MVDKKEEMGMGGSHLAQTCKQHHTTGLCWNPQGKRRRGCLRKSWRRDRGFRTELVRDSDKGPEPDEMEETCQWPRLHKGQRA